MSPSQELLIEPPATIQNAARRWLQSVRPVLGNEFLSAYITGSALTQGFNPRRSDVNVLVVTREFDSGGLDRLAGALRRPSGAVRISPLFLTRAQIEKSLDVFPMEFLDLQEVHLLLEGEDVLATVDVPRTYLRLQCEHELRGKFIQLRQFYLLHHRSPRMLTDTLAAAASSFSTLFRSLLRLRGETTPAHTGRVIERVADIYGLDAQGLLVAYMVRYGRRPSHPTEVRRVYLLFLGAVERLVTTLDQLQVR